MRKMKKLYLLIPLLIAVALAMVACNSTPDTSSELKVISYNIRLLTPGDTGDFAWDARKEASINMINTEKPDVIGFQEPWLPQIEYLVERLPQYGCVKVGRETGLREDGGEHIMAMWNKEKYDLLDSGHFWLSETPDVVSMGWDAACYRVAQWLRLSEKSTGKEFYFFNTHLDHMGTEARREGAKLIVRKMKEFAEDGVTVILAGDMNAILGTSEEAWLEPYKEWMESVRETAPETDHRITFHGFGTEEEPQIIDYIYYRNAEPLRYETLDGDGYGTRYISDHYPILGIFKF